MDGWTSYNYHLPPSLGYINAVLCTILYSLVRVLLGEIDVEKKETTKLQDLYILSPVVSRFSRCFHSRISWWKTCSFLSIFFFSSSNGPVQLNEFVKFTHTRNSTISDAARVLLLSSHQTKYILPIFYIVWQPAVVSFKILCRVCLLNFAIILFSYDNNNKFIIDDHMREKSLPPVRGQLKAKLVCSPSSCPFHIFLYPSRALFHLYFKLVQPKLCFFSLFSSSSSSSFDICLWERTMCVSQESFQ